MTLNPSSNGQLMKTDFEAGGLGVGQFVTRLLGLCPQSLANGLSGRRALAAYQSDLNSSVHDGMFRLCRGTCPRGFFAAVMMMRNVGVLCRKRKPDSLCRFAETTCFGVRAQFCARVLGHRSALPYPRLWHLSLRPNRGALSIPRPRRKIRSLPLPIYRHVSTRE
jgi:hypothetical protein